jgi:hypothetical protein
VILKHDLEPGRSVRLVERVQEEMLKNIWKGLVKRKLDFTVHKKFEVVNVSKLCKFHLVIKYSDDVLIRKFKHSHIPKLLPITISRIVKVFEPFIVMKKF